MSNLSSTLLWNLLHLLLVSQICIYGMRCPHIVCLWYLTCLWLLWHFHWGILVSSSASASLSLVPSCSLPAWCLFKNWLCSRLQINNPFIGDDGQFDRMITPQIPDLKNEAIQPHSNIVSNRTCQNCKNCYTKVWFHSSRYTITCLYSSVSLSVNKKWYIWSSITWKIKIH